MRFLYPDMCVMVSVIVISGDSAAEPERDEMPELMMNDSYPVSETCITTELIGAHG